MCFSIVDFVEYMCNCVWVGDADMLLLLPILCSCFLCSTFCLKTTLTETLTQCAESWSQFAVDYFFTALHLMHGIQCSSVKKFNQQQNFR